MAVIEFLFIIALVAGIIILQICFSKKESKWLGLILPIISLCISLIFVYGIVAFTALTAVPVVDMGAVVSTITDENGLVVREEIISNRPETMNPDQDIPSLIFTIVSAFSLFNIPTIILLAIYFACRGRFKRKLDLDKMIIQDLE